MTPTPTEEARPVSGRRGDSKVEFASLIIALAAMALSGVATFEQFFHRTSSLHAFVQSVGLDAASDPPGLELSLLLSNSSETPGVVQHAYIFISPDTATPRGAHSTSPNSRFWWGADIDSALVVNENTIRQLRLRLALETADHERFLAATRDRTAGDWRIGLVLSAMDINGVRHFEEIFVGQVSPDGLSVKPGPVQPIHLY